MRNVEVVRGLSSELVAPVTALAERAEAVDGYRFLSDHLWIELHAASPESCAALVLSDDGDLVAYAQASPANETWVVEATVDPARREHDAVLLPAVLTALLDDIGTDDERPVWWTHDTASAHRDVAASLGLRPTRRLRKMHVELPLARRAGIVTRPFRVGADEQAVLAVNNRAFAGHGEQGGWTLDTLRSREREPWFDHAGFRLHERDGRLAGFCWTKLHDTDERRVGEIYVVAVDPDHQGLGLGSELTLAGLESIGDRGVGEAMLFVDEENHGAIAMYERLGFDTTRLDEAFA